MIRLVHARLNWTENPYPDQREKERLRALTGLSTQQISDYYCNFRKRHWYPVVSGKRQPKNSIEKILWSKLSMGAGSGAGAGAEVGLVVNNNACSVVNVSVSINDENDEHPISNGSLESASPPVLRSLNLSPVPSSSNKASGSGSCSSAFPAELPALSLCPSSPSLAPLPFSIPSPFHVSYYMPSPLLKLCESPTHDFDINISTSTSTSTSASACASVSTAHNSSSSVNSSASTSANVSPTGLYCNLDYV
jgi:Homeobox KN domain